MTQAILVSSDDELWALCVWREARGASDEAKLGVAQVIYNRASDPKGRWPNSVRKVILQPKQFSSFNPGDPNHDKYPGPEEIAWRACKAAVEAVKKGGEDKTLGANHYHSIPEGKPWPKWTRPEFLTAKIGPFRFYKL